MKLRIAPSPTGSLHIGNARTAVFNWLYAKANGGTFVVRIDDTDIERSTEEFQKDILENLIISLIAEGPSNENSSVNFLYLLFQIVCCL